MRSRNLRQIWLMAACSWLVFASSASIVSAQRQRVSTAESSQSEEATLRTQLAEASREYKSSLEQLAVKYEADVTRAAQRLAQVKELCAQGLARRQEVESAAEIFNRA